MDDFLFKCLASSPSPLVPESDTLWLWLRVVGFLGILGAGGYLISQYKRKRIVNSPAQIKLTIAGSGKASKKEVLDAVMYNLKLNKPPKPDDSADALAIALTKLNEDGIN